MLNRVILEGHLGADPERNETPTGKVVTRFPLPLYNPYKKDNEPTEWAQCEVWNKTAEWFAEKGAKGALVSVEGRLRNKPFTDKTSGTTRYSTFISVDRLTLLRSPNPNPNPNSNSTPSSNQAENKKPASNASDELDKMFEDFDF